MKEKVGIFFRWNFILPIFIILCRYQLNVVGAATLNEESTTPKTTKGSPISASLCPNPSTILPCTCSKSPYGVAIWCEGSTVNQTAITTTFRELCEVNGIPEGRGIHISHFLLFITEMTQLDLAPFYGSRLDSLVISHNSNLTRLVTSGNSQDHGSIHVTNLSFMESFLRQETLRDALKYFSKEMDSFSALCTPPYPHKDRHRHRDTYADEDEGEFIPGLSSLTNLSELSIRNCGINGQLNRDRWDFTGFQRIQRLDLASNNINWIGDGVFDFDFDLDELSPHKLAIFLEDNQLNETCFHPNSGIAKTGRETHLDLWRNPITTLPAPIFETFLDAHEQNGLSLLIPLICDERLGWLKSRRGEFQNRVDDAYCSNDPGHTVFDSILIPIPPRLPPIFAPLCPNSSAILPCTCYNSSTGLSISCSGSGVNQTGVTTAFREIRKVNGIPEGRGIHIYEFVLHETKWTQLDLAPFYGSRLDSLTVAFNANLMTLVTSGYEEDQGSIQVNLLQIVNSPVNSQGFGDLLKYFSKDRKTTVDLSNNQLTTLPAPIFETFLDAHAQNFLRLTGNPLVCDQRLSWIKARAFEFVYWVENANCANDPGHTVFNSALIP